jgi:hypothetical protein
MHINNFWQKTGNKGILAAFLGKVWQGYRKDGAKPLFIYFSFSVAAKP